MGTETSTLDDGGRASFDGRVYLHPGVIVRAGRSEIGGSARTPCTPLSSGSLAIVSTLGPGSATIEGWSTYPCDGGGVVQVDARDGQSILVLDPELDARGELPWRWWLFATGSGRIIVETERALSASSHQTSQRGGDVVFRSRIPAPVVADPIPDPPPVPRSPDPTTVTPTVDTRAPVPTVARRIVASTRGIIGAGMAIFVRVDEAALIRQRVLRVQRVRRGGRVVVVTTVLGVGSRRIAANTAGSVRVRLSPSGRRIVRGLRGRGALILETRATDASGNSSTTRSSVVLSP